MTILKATVTKENGEQIVRKAAIKVESESAILNAKRLLKDALLSVVDNSPAIPDFSFCGLSAMGDNRKSVESIMATIKYELISE